MNAFEKYADQRMTYRAKRDFEKRIRAEMKSTKPPMILTGLEKKQADAAKQLVLYRRWKKEIREALKAGEYGREVVQLLKILRRPKDPKTLVAYVRDAAWMQKCNTRARETLLGYIGHAIMRHREREGWPPFDDPVPTFDGSPNKTNAFLMIRKILTGV